MAHLLASSQHSQAHTTQHRRRLICPSSSPPPQTFLRSLKPADLTLEEAGSRLRQALDRVSHTNDIHQRTTQSVSLPTSVNLSACRVLITVFVVCPHSVPSQCHTTLLPVSLLYSRLVGWFVSCYRTPLNTTLLLSALTIGICLVSHSLAGTYILSSQTPLSLFLSIPNIYYQTSLYNSSHRIVYSTYIQMSSVSCQISRPLLLVWLVCQTRNSVAVCIYVPNAVIFSVTLSSPEPMYLKCTRLACLMSPTQCNTSSLATSSHHACLLSHSLSGTS